MSVSIFMVRDEAPAGHEGGVNDLGATTWKPVWPCEPGLDLSGPTSFVAAEIHLGCRPAGIHDDWPHCNIQVACQIRIYKIPFYFSMFRVKSRNYEADFTAALGAIAYELGDADECLIFLQ
jgi:hypothetical protein